MANNNLIPAALQERIADVEAGLPSLTDAAATAGLRAYSTPDDADLRQAADDTMMALRDAREELERLRLALPAAEQAERDRVEAEAMAERQKTKDRLGRERDRLMRLAEAEAEKFQAASSQLPEAETQLAEAKQKHRNAAVKVQVLREQRENATDHYTEYAEAADELAAEIAAFPVTTEEVAAAEARRAAVEAAEEAEMAAPDDGDELVDVGRGWTRYFNEQSRKIGWLHDGPACTGRRIKRRDLHQWQADQREAEKWAAEQEHIRQQEERDRLSNAQSAMPGRDFQHPLNREARRSSVLGAGTVPPAERGFTDEEAQRFFAPPAYPVSQ